MNSKQVLLVGLGVAIGFLAITIISRNTRKTEGFTEEFRGGGRGRGRPGRGGRGWWGGGRWWGRPLGYWYSPWSVYNDIYSRCVCDDRYFNDIQAGVAPNVALNKMKDCRTLFGC